LYVNGHGAELVTVSLTRDETFLKKYLYILQYLLILLSCRFIRHFTGLVRPVSCQFVSYEFFTRKQTRT